MSIKTIYKYAMDDNTMTNQSLILPAGAQVIDFQIVNNRFMIWAIVCPIAEHGFDHRVFRIFATGDAFRDTEYEYIMTAHWNDSREVWHLFEKRKA